MGHPIVRRVFVEVNETVAANFLFTRDVPMEPMSPDVLEESLSASATKT